MRKWSAAIVLLVCVLLVTGAVFASAQYSGNKTEEFLEETNHINNSKTNSEQNVVSQEEAEKGEGVLPDIHPDETAGNPDYFPEIPEKEESPDELEHSADSHDYLSKYEGQYVEFVGFADQEISNEFQSFIISNLSSNECNIVFELQSGGEVIYTSKLIAPGMAEAINLYQLLGKGVHELTIISKAYAFDETQLNAVSQVITVTVNKKEADVEDTANVYPDVSNGSTFNTTVVYRADTTNYSVSVPAAISIVEGTKGTEFMIGFRVQNLKEGNALYLTSAGGLNGKEEYQLAHDSSNDSGTGSIKYVVSSDSSKDAMIVGYNFEENDTLVHWVGPAYCLVGDGKQAASTYYGIMVFELIEGGVADES